jgi:caffeoyl-CoA O-methyltransferase
MPSDLLAPGLAGYLDSLVPPRHPVLAEMEAEAARTGFPIIGPATGHLCYLLARAIGARRVFELGSGFGYSTAWFAKAVRENGGGTVHHVVWDQALSDSARTYLTAMDLADIVEFRTGEAVATLRDTAGPFDLIFNDIDKAGYPASLEVIVAKLRPGGLLLVDNLLWSGRVLDPTDRTPDTEGVRTLTRLVGADPHWISSVIPVRDGLMVAYRSGIA